MIPRDLQRLAGVHEDLTRVLVRADTTVGKVPFMVLEGVRSAARQRELVASGASRTMRSRHLTGHAVDLGVLVNGELRWDWPLYEELGGFILRCAAAEHVALTWGGNWPRFRDGPHFELDWKAYPK